MSGRGNRHDNARGENVFNLLELERSRRRATSLRDKVRPDVSDYIEVRIPSMQCWI
jgi:hypothetical protein